MGRKGKWFSSVKKALSPDSKEKKDKKSKKKWFGKQTDIVSNSSAVVETVKTPPPSIPLLQQPEEDNVTEAENEQRNIAATVAVTTTTAASVQDPVDDASQTVKEVVQITTNTRFLGKSKEEAAAIRIQTAFRGYLARRALRALRGLVRLQSLMEGTVVKRQACNTLRCMQTLSRVQSQIRSRRIRMSEENQALQKQLLQKHAKELATQIGENWDDSAQSKEQVEANLLSKYEATMRRERAMAYSFSHQQTWKNSSRSANPMFMDPRNPSWGWSWLERWMAARPWESRGVNEKEPKDDQSSVKSASCSIVGGEISRSYARYQLNTDKLSPTTNQKTKLNTDKLSPTTNQKTKLNTDKLSPTTNPKTSKTPSQQSPSTPSKPTIPTVTRKLKSASPKGSVSGLEDDARSMISMQSEKSRRHSIAGSSVRDDESLSSSPAAPRYMVPTESARAKSRLQSPLGVEKNCTPEKGSPATAKKRLSYPPSPARPRRHSGPPKLDCSINSEISITNGGA